MEFSRATAIRRDSGRNYISSECKSKLDSFRFRGPCVHTAEEPQRQDNYKSKPFVQSPEGMDNRTMSGYGGNDMTCPDGNELLEGGDGGKELCGNESAQTDYGSSTMFDDEDEAWFQDQTEQNYNMMDMSPDGDFPPVTGVPVLSDQGATPGPKPGSYPWNLKKKLTLPLNVEGVLSESSKYALEYHDNDEPHEYNEDTLGIFGKASSPLGRNIGAFSSNPNPTLPEHPCSSYYPTTGQLSPPFTEERFFSDNKIPSTAEDSPNSSKYWQSEPAKIKNDGVIVVRCRATDIVRNGKLRWVDVTESVRRAKKITPAWPLYPDRTGIMEPIERPPFPVVVKERSPIYGLSATTTVKTCFHIKDAMEVATLVAGGKFKGDVLVELFAKVLQNRTIEDGTRQKFQFCDIFLIGPPFLPGEYTVPKACGPWDTDSKVFTGTAMVRVVGRMNKRNSTREWILKIENIREVGWDDVGWVKGIICGNGKN
ncbi:hypothetical protein L873DRAFT_1201403 [Choiromyces venosus 120613-1]|uniref:Uncharacterized protein n=1 Tax=Choiromyces venosus 120613-1 TaxID=1336337 RepID=A0A3N4JKA1_9PEZI|nr:hypothetical protein L873DRAFT_1201403 [Choiromyces venosus 120613-1]